MYHYYGKYCMAILTHHYDHCRTTIRSCGILDHVIGCRKKLNRLTVSGPSSTLSGDMWHSWPTALPRFGYGGATGRCGPVTDLSQLKCYGATFEPPCLKVWNVGCLVQLSKKEGEWQLHGLRKTTTNAKTYLEAVLQGGERQRVGVQHKDRLTFLVEAGVHFPRSWLIDEEWKQAINKVHYRKKGKWKMEKKLKRAYSVDQFSRQHIW